VNLQSIATQATAVLVLALGLAPSLAFAEPEGKISEIQEQAGGSTSVLVQLGKDGGIRVGQTVEVRRGGRTVGYGSVVKVFKALSVVSVGTVIPGSGELQAGDSVVFLDSGFARTSGPTARVPKGTPPPVAAMPSGKVASVRDGVILLDFGSKAGLRVGDVIVLRSPEGDEVGKISVELVGPKSAGGLLTSGKATVGNAAVSIGRATPARGAIDFVALDFLGVVANLEHPTPHRAACHVGVPVRRIIAGSPAEKAGIGKGDRLISVDGIVVRDIAAVRERVQARDSRRVRVVLLRGDRIVAVDVDFETE
jgi:membrane-associated protease RseP (regulator of RpoE activity)